MQLQVETMCSNKFLSVIKKCNDCVHSLSFQPEHFPIWKISALVTRDA